jgi:hypothetical protein
MPVIYRSNPPARDFGRAARETSPGPISKHEAARRQPRVQCPRHMTADRVFEVLADAAARGAPCPTNKEISDTVGLLTASNASEMVRRLEAAGRIRVNRFSCTRVIEIVATGARTAMPANTRPHWRLRRRT